MKNVQKLFSMAMLMCMAITMFSCSKDEEAAIFAEADLMGSWEVTSSNVSIEGAEVSKQEQALLALLAETEGNIFEFKEGGEFEKESMSLFSSDGDNTYTEEGTWKLNGDNTLIITDEDEDESQYKVASLNAGSAVIVQNTSEEGVTMTITTNLAKK